jgi:hypothetical protein
MDFDAGCVAVALKQQGRMVATFSVRAARLGFASRQPH